MALGLSLDSFRQKSLFTRTLVTVLSMLAVFSVVIGGLSFAAVAATKAVFPRAEAEHAEADPESSAKGIAAAPGAGEADRAAPTSKRPKPKTRPKGDSKE